MGRDVAKPVLICDPDVLAVPIEECEEPLVDTREYPLLVDEKHPRVESAAKTRFFCRRSVAERLRRADKLLPDGLRLLMLECHRPVELQARYWEGDLRDLRDRYPEWPEKRLAEKNAEFVAPPWDTPPHSTGGAVDLTLSDEEGRELDLGSPVNELGPLMKTAAEGLTARAAENRRLLLDVMCEAGFVNYGYEWWDYHFGDRYWAYIRGESSAFYGRL